MTAGRYAAEARGAGDRRLVRFVARHTFIAGDVSRVPLPTEIGMPISPYLQSLRERVGHARLVLPSVTALVYDADGRILLVCERDGGVWSTPGGVIEPDETPADAVVREAWEETGLHVAPVRLVGVYGGPDFVVRYASGDEAQYVMSVFECRPRGGRLRPGDETSEARFISAEEAAGLTLSSWLGTLLATFFARPGEPDFRPPAWLPPDVHGLAA
jgi:8-oxo-dGTP pyrophosphatase MutT (NUDIX family)